MSLMFSTCSSLLLPQQVENVLIIFHVFSGRRSGLRRFCFFFQNQKKFPIVWFQLLGGFPANIGYQSTNCMSAFGLLQLNALVAFDFLTCILSSATAACAYVFKGTLILSTLGRRRREKEKKRKLSWSFFFLEGSWFVFFLGEKS